MTEPAFNVLFLCTGNSARSVMAEALLAVLGKGRFNSYSAGSHPSGRVQPMAADLAAKIGFDTANLRSKNWDEFSTPDAPRMDLIITVCDNAAGESCPFWPGHPATAHWGVADPAALEGDEATRRHAYLEAFSVLRRRVELLVALPMEKLDQLALQGKAREIGEQGIEGEATSA
ncbi:arsenate reductase ArsC [Lysobacter fragariae]